MDQNARTRLIIQLERIIASHCSTKNLNNGSNYRFPVHYYKNGRQFKTVGQGVANVDDNGIRTMKYTFASHTLEIGKALDEILDFLEKNCEFDSGLYYIDDIANDSDDPYEDGEIFHKGFLF